MKKLLLSFLLGLTIFLSFAPYLSSTKAQEWYSQNPVEWYLKVYDKGISPSNEIFGERYTAAQVQWVFYGIISMPVRMLESVVGENSITCFMKGFTGTIDPADCISGIADITTKIMDAIFPYWVASSDNRPLYAKVLDSSQRSISGIGYTKDLINKFSLVSEVKAQGVGFEGLTWLQKYWKGFRDMSYALLVLVVIVFAFMIMFRVKLSPQTVISVQSALPKIVVALVLITFSYAIAGFAIDLMYVVSGLFVVLLKAAEFASTNSNNAWLMISGTGAGYSIAGGFWVFFVMLGYAVMFLIAGVWSFITTLAGGASIFGALVAVLFIILTVWVLVLMLWYTIKIPYVLIKTLISFYLSVITAPIQILAGTVSPSMGFGPWFKRIMADILVFPVTGLLFWFAWSTLWTSYAQAFGDLARGWWLDDTQMWAPGIIGSAADMSGLIFLAISFGIITLIPKVPEMLKGLIMGERFSFGTAMGEAIGPLKTAWGMTGATAAQGIGRYGQEKTTQRIAEAIQSRTSAGSDKYNKTLARLIPGSAKGWAEQRGKEKVQWENKKNL